MKLLRTVAGLALIVVALPLLVVWCAVALLGALLLWLAACLLGERQSFMEAMGVKQDVLPALSEACHCPSGRNGVPVR